MFVTLTPKASTPPSPKSSAWNSSATRDRDQPGPGAEQDRDQRSAHRVRRGAVRDRHVEHHDHEADGGEHGQRGHVACLDPAPHAARGEPEHRDRDGEPGRAGLRAQVPVGNVHAVFRLDAVPENFCLLQHRRSNSIGKPVCPVVAASAKKTNAPLSGNSCASRSQQGGWLRYTDRWVTSVMVASAAIPVGLLMEDGVTWTRGQQRSSRRPAATGRRRRRGHRPAPWWA